MFSPDPVVVGWGGMGVTRMGFVDSAGGGATVVVSAVVFVLEGVAVDVAFIVVFE